MNILLVVGLVSTTILCCVIADQARNQNIIGPKTYTVRPQRKEPWHNTRKDRVHYKLGRIRVLLADDRLGPEERRTLLADDDDDVFSDDINQSGYNSNSRQQNCARDFEDCTYKRCCSECTRCSCNRNRQNCRCNGRNELALFVGVCRR